MWLNYLITALRAFSRHKLHFSLNIAGLTLGLAAAILIALYARHEASYDQWLPQAQQVFRVEQYIVPLNGGIPIVNKNTMNRLRDLAGIDDVLLVEPLAATTEFRLGENSYRLTGMMGASANLPQFLPLTVLAGDLNKAMATPGQLAISQQLAVRLFGQNTAWQQVIGNTLQQGETRWTIAAVFANLPANTHFAFDGVFQLKPFREQYSANNAYAYVRLHEGVDVATVQQQLAPAYVKIAYPGESPDMVKISLQPLTGIHLNGNNRLELKASGTRSNLWICIGLSVLLLGLAGVNFVNMSIAQSARRAKEVGVRKAMGASHWQIISQFLVESVLITLIAGVLACAAAELLLPWFNGLVERQLALTYLSDFGAGLLLILLLTGVIAGAYPAFFMAAFSAKRVLSGDLQRGKTAVLVRKGLLTLQSALSVALIIAAVLLQQQLHYLQNLPVGYERAGRIQVADIQSEKILNVANPQLMQRVKAIPGVLDVGAVDIPITGSFNSSMPLNSDNGVLTEQMIPLIGVGYRPVELLGLQLLAGRDFSESTASDWYHEPNEQLGQASILLTQTLARQAGFASAQDAIGHLFSATDSQGKTYQFTVVGVVSDIKVGSTRANQAAPVLICGYTNNWYSKLLLKVDMDQLPAIRVELSKVLGQALNMYAPTIEVLAEDYKAIYRSDERTALLVSIFSGLAIALACFGVFGLASFSVLRRQKEVSVRKVLGASRLSIVNLLASEYLTLVALSVAIAFPLTWWLVQDWLAGFNDRIEQSVVVYLLSALIVAAITWFTVASIAFKAASSRPAQILRCE